MSGIGIFSRLYFYQPFLPLWILAGLAWWTLQLAIRRARGEASGVELLGELAAVSIGLGLGALWLGPIPFYAWLLFWLFDRVPRWRRQRLLRNLNWALAIFLASSYAWTGYRDFQEPWLRLGRVLGPEREERLQAMADSGQIEWAQAQNWARSGSGRARENAIRLLGYFPGPEAERALLELARSGSPDAFARAARETLERRRRKEKSLPETERLSR